MANMLTVEDTRKMSDTRIKIALGERNKELENLGMDHESACAFVASVMNLGIAAHERRHNISQK